MKTLTCLQPTETTPRTSVKGSLLHKGSDKSHYLKIAAIIFQELVIYFSLLQVVIALNVTLQLAFSREAEPIGCIHTYIQMIDDMGTFVIGSGAHSLWKPKSPQSAHWKTKGLA